MVLGTLAGVIGFSVVGAACTVDGSSDSFATGIGTAPANTESGTGSGPSTSDAGAETGEPKLDVGADGPDNPEDPDDPTSCAEAAGDATYVGCDFWPTVTYNPVLENFDFTAVTRILLLRVFTTSCGSRSRAATLRTTSRAWARSPSTSIGAVVVPW